jgi:hypothetical protein
MSQRRGRLPNFIIIGAAKAGTTSLYHYLKQHPQVFMSPIKEARYFSYDGKDTRDIVGEPLKLHFPAKTLTAYMALFKDARDEIAVGEASPIYMESPTAAARIREVLPEVKLVAILRNSIERAISHYLMRVRIGLEPWDVREAFRNEQASFLQDGFYYPQLKRFYDLFPQGQIQVCLFDDLQHDPLSLARKIYCFLGVDATFEPNVETLHNVGGFPRSRIVNAILARVARLYERKAIHAITPAWVVSLYDSVYKKNLNPRFAFPQDLRKRLADLYEDDILKIQDLVQQDLQHWLTC